MQKEEFISYDAAYYNDPTAGVTAHAAPDVRIKAGSLSFWCPVQRQKLATAPNAAVRLEVAAIGIPQAEFASIIRQCIDCSQLLHALEAKGLDTWIADDPHTATITLQLDSSICTSADSYEIQCSEKNNRVVIVAADSRGLLYALQTFTQLMKYHSRECTAEHVSRHATRSIGSYEDIGAELTVVNLPAAVISDCPAVQQRAVLWSMKQLFSECSADMSTAMIRSTLAEPIALLSRARINRLYLVLDCFSDDLFTAAATTAAIVSGSAAAVGVGAVDVVAEELRLQFLESVVLPQCIHLCAAYFIDAVPAMNVTSIKQTMPLTALKHFKTQSLLFLFQLDYKSVAADLVFNSRRTSTGGVITPAGVSVTTVVSAATASSNCSKCCRKLLADAAAAGFTDVAVSCSDWVHSTTDFKDLAASIDPSLLLSLTEQRLTITYPSILLTKPIMCVQDFTICLKMYLKHVLQETNGSLAMFPLCDAADAMRPSLLNKMYLILFGGATWSNSRVSRFWGAADEIAAARAENSRIADVVVDMLFPPLAAHCPAAAATSSSSATTTATTKATQTTTKATTTTAAAAASGDESTLQQLPPVPPSTPAAATDKVVDSEERVQRSEFVETVAIPQCYRAAITSLLLGEAANTMLHTAGAETSSNVKLTYGGGSTAISHSDLHYDYNCDSDRKLTLSDLAKAEKMLWSLLIAFDDLSFNAVPQKNEVALCLQLYRRLLATAHWKPKPRYPIHSSNSSSNRSSGNSNSGGREECECLFALLNTASVLSRAIFISSAGVVESHELSSLVAAPIAEGFSRASSVMRSSQNHINYSSSSNNSSNGGAGDGAGEFKDASDSSSNNNNNSSSHLFTGAQQQALKRAAVYDNIDMSQPYVPKQQTQKDPRIDELLTKVVRQNLLFRNYTAEQHALIVSGFESLEVQAGAVVIKQGDLGEFFYILESGRADIFMESSGFKIKIGRTLTAGDYFGELALMYNTPRAATVVAADNCKLWCIDRQTYRTIVTQHSRTTAMEFVNLISNVCILGKRIGDVFSPVELNKVVSSLEAEEFQHGQVIVRQHLTGDYFYIITEGHVDVWQQQQADGTSTSCSNSNNSSGGVTPKGNNNSNKSTATAADTAASAAIVAGEGDLDENTSLLGTRVATLTRGDYFGELSLLADDVRQASCVAVGKVVCLSLSRDDFIAIFGNWDELTAKADARRQTQQSLLLKQQQQQQQEQQQQQPEQSASREEGDSNSKNNISSSNQLSQMKLSDLRVLSVLGVGAFGKVSLVQHSSSGAEYALKAQSKSHVVAQGMQDMLRSELRIMRQLQHPCIARLFAAMQDAKFVYFVLELLPGGEFFNYLGKVGKLNDDQARFYSAAVVLAFEEMHKHQIAYRDLKPENMVLDARGYVKLVDLGLAKQISDGSTWTMCGTPDYLAPEIVLNKGHDYAVDYWALGVLIYEMIHGWPPFYNEDQMRVYAKIVKGKVDYPDSFSSSLEDLISKLLVKNPSKRLGNMRHGTADVVKHKWFGSFDWQGLLLGRINAPHVPPPLATKATATAIAAEGEEGGSSGCGDCDDDDDDAPDANAEESDWVLDLL